MNHTEHKEYLALKIGNSKVELLKVLKDDLSCMNDYTRNIFKDCIFDFNNKRLVSKCKKYSFQWQLRPEPNKPESPNNQQTTLGYTSVKIN
jgi:hypothetical protein